MGMKLERERQGRAGGRGDARDGLSCCRLMGGRGAVMVEDGLEGGEERGGQLINDTVLG